MGKAILSLLMFAVYFCNYGEAFAYRTIQAACFTPSNSFSICDIDSTTVLYNCISGGLCTPAQYGAFQCVVYEDGCKVADNLREELCPYVPDAFKEFAGCSQSSGSLEGEPTCKKYSDILGQPYDPSLCNFETKHVFDCYDGEGKKTSSHYDLRSIDTGKVGSFVSGASDVECNKSVIDVFSDWQIEDMTAPSIDEVPGGGFPSGDCQKEITIKGDETVVADICGEDGEPIDSNRGDDWYESCVYTDSEGVIRFKDECKTAEENYFDDCIYQDENGVWKERENCTPGGGGGNNGGGTPGGGGDGGSGGGTPGGTGTPGGGGTPGGSGGDNGGSGGGGGTPGGTGTPGGGSGGDEGGGGDNPGGGGGGVVVVNPGDGGNGDGDGDDLGSHSGDGGWGGIGGIEGMDKGEGDLNGILDGFFEKIEKSETFLKIKDHEFVKITSKVCYLDFDIPFFSHTIDYHFSLCEYEDQLRFFGNLLFGLVTLSGFVMIMRS